MCVVQEEMFAEFIYKETSIANKCFDDLRLECLINDSINLMCEARSRCNTQLERSALVTLYAYGTQILLKLVSLPLTHDFKIFFSL